MKFCQKCGKELDDGAVICTGCGCAVKSVEKTEKGGQDGLSIVAKIFLIIGCIAQGWLLIPLAWCLPITISICGKMTRKEHIGTGLKVCALLFVSLFAGILLLCRADET